MVFLLGMLLLVMDYRSTSQKIENGLLRNDYGEGAKTEELQIRINGGERKELDVEISEKMYEEEEVKELFQRCIFRSYDCF